MDSSLDLLSSFDPWALFISTFFGLVGYAVWRYGRRLQSTRHLTIAVALMSYGLFVTDAVWSAVVGGVLTVLVFWP